MFTMTQRLKFAQRLKGQGGFTLLELLVVVAILAIVATGLLAAYDGLEKRAALAQASHGIASVDEAVRSFTALRGSAPNNLDSLLAATPVDGSQSPATIAGGVEVITLTNSLAGKITETPLLAAQRTSLIGAGITSLRYIDALGNVNTCAPTCLLTTDDPLAADAYVGNISTTDIPVRIFDIPRDGSTLTAARNRGRGYSHTLVANDAVSVWFAGAGGINNTKVAAGATDVLIAFGLGNSSSILTVDGTARGDAHLSAAPTYPDTAKNEYSRYVLLYNVGPLGFEFPKARLQAVVDARGDFLDEELAEASGQKQ